MEKLVIQHDSPHFHKVEQNTPSFARDILPVLQSQSNQEPDRKEDLQSLRHKPQHVYGSDVIMPGKEARGCSARQSINVLSANIDCQRTGWSRCHRPCANFPSLLPLDAWLVNWQSDRIRLRLTHLPVGMLAGWWYIAISKHWTKFEYTHCNRCLVKQAHLHVEYTCIAQIDLNTLTPIMFYEAYELAGSRGSCGGWSVISSPIIGVSSREIGLVQRYEDRRSILMPVRKVSNRSKKNTIGDFPSLKMKRMIAFESLIERDGIYTFDFEQDVLAFEEQPLSIEYEHEGKKRHYTPDFLLKKPNQSVLVECKPEVFVDSDENRRKFDAARQWCEEHGYHFQVLTDAELRAGFRLENIKLLTRFARQRVGPEMRSRIYSRLYSSGNNPTVHTLALYVSPTTPTIAISAILHMAFHHEIVLSLNEAKITGDTLVSLAR